MEIRFTLERGEVREGLSFAGQKKKRNTDKWKLILLVYVQAAGFALGCAAVMRLVYRDETLEWVAAAAGLLLTTWIEKMRLRMAQNFLWKQKFGVESAIRIGDDYFGQEIGGNAARYPWGNVTGWIDTPRTMLIQTTAGAIIVPKRALSETQRIELSGLLTRKVAEGRAVRDAKATGGFPVQ